MSAQDSHEIGVIKIMLTKGADGRGIEKIEKTSTSGIYDTYTITYDDGSKTTYTIANGNGIQSVEKTGTSGLVDTYTITFDNGMVETFDVTNGDYISNIAKTGTSGAVDTYTITMASGTTYTFTVVNGDGSLATDIIFDDTTAQLSASTAQGAIDALAKPTFTEASTRANIASGEKLSVILGKIKKFFTDLKTVAFSGSFSDLSGKPGLLREDVLWTNSDPYSSFSDQTISGFSVGLNYYDYIKILFKTNQGANKLKLIEHIVVVPTNQYVPYSDDVCRDIDVWQPTGSSAERGQISNYSRRVYLNMSNESIRIYDCDNVQFVFSGQESDKIDTFHVSKSTYNNVMIPYKIIGCKQLASN